MKKPLIIIHIFVFLFIAGRVYSIVIIPPIIYIATLSIGSFIINLCAFTALWMAAKGIIDRAYFGKKTHEIVHLLFVLIGRSIILVFSAIISIIVFNPLNMEEIIFSSLSAAVFSLLVLWLNSFREYRLVQKQEKITILKSLASFSIVVFLTTFISASAALETKILHTDNTSAQQNPQTPLLKLSAPDLMEDRKAGIQLPYNTTVKKTLLFYPQNADLCEIYLGNILISSSKSSRNCYYYRDNGETEKIYCPIPLNISRIPQNLTEQSAPGDIRGRGSCEEKYPVSLTKEGFKIRE